MVCLNLFPRVQCAIHPKKRCCGVEASPFVCLAGFVEDLMFHLASPQARHE